MLFLSFKVNITSKTIVHTVQQQVFLGDSHSCTTMWKEHYSLMLIRLSSNYNLSVPCCIASTIMCACIEADQVYGSFNYTEDDLTPMNKGANLGHGGETLQNTEKSRIAFEGH